MNVMNRLSKFEIFLIIAAIFILGATFLVNDILAEHINNPPYVDETSSFFTINSELETLGHGTTIGSYSPTWNRLISASTWVPDGNVTEEDVLLGKTFYSDDRSIKTGVLVPTMNYEDQSLQLKYFGITERVTSILIQDDSKILVFGDFISYKNTGRERILRLNSDGSLDTTFDSGDGPNNKITSMAIAQDGKIIITGSFTSYDGETIHRIARLNSDGSLDETFNPTGTPSGINVVKIQEDGKILIAGTFTSYDGVARQRVARINSDGSLDETFDSSNGVNNNAVASIAIQEDGKILLGGHFTSYAGVTTYRIARLNSDGSLDETFDSSDGFGNGSVYAIKVQEDGKIVVGGTFMTYDGVTRQRIARLNSNGSLDGTFDSSNGVSGTVSSIVLLNDGKIVVGGTFSSYGGVTRQRIARLNSDGSLDLSFGTTNATRGSFSDFDVDSNGNIYIAGIVLGFGDKVGDIVKLDSDGLNSLAGYWLSGEPLYTDDIWSQWTQTNTSPEVWKDERTGIYWSPRYFGGNNFNSDCTFFTTEPRGSYDGSDSNCGMAINACANLSLPTYTGGAENTNWYLPTDAEIWQAYLNGIYPSTNPAWFIANIWTSVPYSTNWAYAVVLSSGQQFYMSNVSVIYMNYYFCISRGD